MLVAELDTLRKKAIFTPIRQKGDRGGLSGESKREGAEDSEKEKERKKKGRKAGRCAAYLGDGLQTRPRGFVFYR